MALDERLMAIFYLVNVDRPTRPKTSMSSMSCLASSPSVVERLVAAAMVLAERRVS
jgi:hypothetical protein